MQDAIGDLNLNIKNFSKLKYKKNYLKDFGINIINNRI